MILKNIISISILIFSVLFFSACTGQPTSTGTTAADENSKTWTENTNVDADEYETVDVSDLDKSVTSASTTQSGTGDTIVQRMPFPAEEYAALARTGKGTIKGQIYLLTAGGQRVPGVKTRLYLNPVTSYSKEWFEISYEDGKKMSEADPRLFNYLKFTASESDGSFSFFGVPTGEYYIIGTVECSSECGYSGNKTIRITDKVAIEDNQIVVQDLSRPVQ
jgi:hypothetical protein